MRGPQREAVGTAGRSLGRSFADAATVAAPEPKSSSRPFSIRLSQAERRRLEQAAGSRPLGFYIRSQLLDLAKPKTPRRPRPDVTALGQILAALGRSSLAAGVADLAAAAKAGTIALTPELEAQIAALSAEVIELRRLLIRALGQADGAVP